MIGEWQPHTSLAPRIACLLGGVSIFILRRELDPRAILVFLFVIFHAGPYLIAALIPVKRETVQIGFIAGLSFSTCPALFLLMVANALGFPGPKVSPNWAYPFAFAADLLLFATVVISWVLRRGEISKRTAVRSLMFGLAYPFPALPSRQSSLSLLARRILTISSVLTLR